MKELHFFDRYWLHPDPDVSAYELYFPRPAGAICGEWTPRYMADHWTPALLAAAAPNTRLLVSLRDPVERYLSGLAWHRDMEKAGGPPVTHVNHGDAVHRGFYEAHLRQVLRHFDRAQLLVLQYEHCVASPASELERTYEFLGIDPELGPDDLGEVHEPRQTSVTMSGRERQELVAVYEQDVSRLGVDFPEIDLALWPNFQHLA